MIPEVEMQKAKFIVLLEELIEVDPGVLTENTVLGELPGWDSVAIMGFIDLMDEELQLSPEPKSIVDCKTVGDLLSLGEGRFV